MEFKKVDKFPCRDLNQLFPKVKLLAEKLVAECKKQGITIIVTQTYRSSEYQQSLYNQGRSTKGSIVTNARPGSSPHEFRVAFDIAIQEGNKINWNSPNYGKVGAIGKKLGLEWGGDFKTITDKPHFQYYGGHTLRDIKLGVIPQ